MKFLVLLSILLVLGSVDGANVNILDQNGELISSIVEQVCAHTSGTNKQISKISSVAQISNYLKYLPLDHKLAACAKLHLKSIQDLAKLVSIRNDNVCSSEKIAAIQLFHRAYILKKNQTSGKVPKILATFFIHYVSSISEICASETATFLRALNSSPESDTTEVDELFAELNSKMGLSSSSDVHYGDMFLLWSMVDLLPIRGDSKIEKYMLEGDERIAIAVNNAEGFNEMKEFCRTTAKPLYSQSLLPTMKLIDMGYYPSGSSILELLNGNNRQARRFYELTKVCDTLLPVRVISAISPTDSSPALVSRQEMAELGLEESQPQPEVNGEPCKRCSMSDSDTLASVTTADAIPIAKRVKSDIKSRKSAISRLLKIFVKKAKANVKLKLKSLFGQEDTQDIENIDENQLDIYEVSEVCEEDESTGNQLLRFRRGLKNVLFSVALKAARIVGVLILTVWILATVFILWPLYIAYSVISWFTGLKSSCLRYFLSTGGLYSRETYDDMNQKEPEY